MGSMYDFKKTEKEYSISYTISKSINTVGKECTCCHFNLVLFRERKKNNRREYENLCNKFHTFFDIPLSKAIITDVEDWYKVSTKTESMGFSFCDLEFNGSNPEVLDEVINKVDLMKEKIPDF